MVNGTKYRTFSKAERKFSPLCVVCFVRQNELISSVRNDREKNTIAAFSNICKCLDL
jgi:hypothetical protein